MGCCFSRDCSDEEITRPHTPRTHYGATGSFQPYVSSNNNIIVQPPSLETSNRNFYHARTSTNSSRGSHRSNREPFKSNRDWNSYHSPTSANYSRLPRPRKIPNAGYKGYSLVKTVESEIHKSVLRLALEWDYMNTNSDFELCLLSSDTTEYEEILRMFKKTTQKHFMVERIYRVQNPYLLGCYLLKKLEIESRYGYVDEEYLFHGTKDDNIEKICKNNFDWRQHGKSAGNTFGKGVSFTPISCYASHYSDKRDYRRIMIVSKVLISHETIGTSYMKLPPVFAYRESLRYDTAIKENRHVIVKFSDNEFYPSYIVCYTGQYQKNEQNEQKPIRV